MIKSRELSGVSDSVYSTFPPPPNRDAGEALRRCRAAGKKPWGAVYLPAYHLPTYLSTSLLTTYLPICLPPYLPPPAQGCGGGVAAVPRGGQDPGSEFRFWVSPVFGQRACL